MGKKIQSIALAIVLLILFAAVSAAEAPYRITYDLGEAAIRADTVENNNPSTYQTNEIVTLSEPECPGFRFVGWFLEPSCQTEITTVGDTPGDITVYAKWIELTYDITYVLTTPDCKLQADEITNPNPNARSAGEAVSLTDPLCGTEIYQFDGWYLDENYTQPISVIEAYTCRDVTLYAHWVAAEFTISYELGKASSSVYPVRNKNPETYTYNQEIPLLDAETDDPAYTFDGWYTDEFYTTKMDTIPAGTKGNLILYANWIETQYQISYVLTDDSGIAAASIRNTNPDIRNATAVLTLSDPVSSDHSYTFAGWYTSPDRKAETRVTQIDTSYDTDLTLYAKWETAVYTIQYDYGKINLQVNPIKNPNPTTYHYGDNTALQPLETDGFLFNGWCTDATLKNHIEAIPADAHENMTLYADFTEKTYTIAYVLDDKGVIASQVVNTNPVARRTSESVTLEDAGTINAEYTFGGWYFDADFTREAKKINAYTAENVTVYAKWIRKSTYLPVWGDASLSEQLTAADARLILRYAASLETFNEVQIRISDINNDSAATAADARLVLRLVAGLESEEALIGRYSLPTIELVDGEVTFREKEE